MKTAPTDSNATARHTPGPWKMEVLKHSGFERDGKPVAYFGVSHESAMRSKIVAFVQPVEIFFHVTGATSPNLEGEADARLIASAPDLLQVARDYVLLCELHDMGGAVLQSAKAAIAKAEGRA